MPRSLGFIGTRVSAEDRLRAVELLKSASAYSAKVNREIDQLQSFMDANNFVRGRIRADEILALFAAQFLRSGRSATTLNALLDDLKSFHVDVFDLESARVKVKSFHVRNAVKRAALVAPRVFVRKNLPTIRLPHQAPTDGKMRERWAFWALVVVTGNRPNNVLRIQSLSVDGEGVTVHWGIRKVHSGTTVRYEFSWTTRPPLWILQRWRVIEKYPWPFPNPATIASAVNGWIKKWRLGAGITSTSPRGAIDEVLREQVISGRLNETIYERIIDHQFRTGLDHYSFSAVNAKRHRTEDH
jgi:hypothetical protein